jgi:hypothetical protein
LAESVTLFNSVAKREKERDDDEKIARSLKIFARELNGQDKVEDRLNLNRCKTLSCKIVVVDRLQLFRERIDHLCHFIVIASLEESKKDSSITNVDKQVKRMIFDSIFVEAMQRRNEERSQSISRSRSKDEEAEREEKRRDRVTFEDEELSA